MPAVLPPSADLAETRTRFLARLAGAGLAQEYLAASDEVSACATATALPAVGSIAPDFMLPDAQGRLHWLRRAASAAPVVVTFYRGSWCPFCSAYLHELARDWPRPHAAGALLWNISPEPPDLALSQLKELKLPLTLLTDSALTVAQRYGLAYAVPSRMQRLLEGWKIDLELRNGARSGWHLPHPGVFVIGYGGKVLLAERMTDPMERPAAAALATRTCELLSEACWGA